MKPSTKIIPFAFMLSSCPVEHDWIYQGILVKQYRRRWRFLSGQDDGASVANCAIFLLLHSRKPGRGFAVHAEDVELCTGRSEEIHAAK